MTTTSYKHQIPRKSYDKYIDEYLWNVLDGVENVEQEVVDMIHFVKSKLDDSDVTIDHDLIEKAVSRTEKYFFKLFPWQKFLYGLIWGPTYKSSGQLVFNEFLIMMGRGGGKTGLEAGIAFNLITMTETKQYHVTFVATSEKQLKENGAFEEIWNLLESDKKKFRKFFRWTKEIIVCKKTQSRISYATSNPKTKDGGKPGAVMFDEVHAYEDEEQIKVHTSGLGKKRPPRRFYFTTDGYNRDGFLDMLKTESKLIYAGDRPKRKMLPMIFRIGKKEDVNNVENWHKANPSLKYLPTLMEEMLDEYEKLKDRPGSYIEFMTKRMNFPIADSYNAVTSWDNILATNQELPNFNGMECIGAVDFSDTDDFTGVGLLFKIGDKYYWKSHTFINIKSIETNNYKIPIDVAIEKGLVTILYTPTNRPEDILMWFINQRKKHGYRIKLIASDMYRKSYLDTKAKEMGMDQLTLSRSGSKTHTELQPTIEDLFAYKNIVYGDDMMMRWYTNNTYVKRDGKGNITYEKIEPKLRKTDGFFAFLHALQHREKLAETVQFTYNRRLKTYTY